jgi:hypothetical protein
MKNFTKYIAYLDDNTIHCTISILKKENEPLSKIFIKSLNTNLYEYNETNLSDIKQAHNLISEKFPTNQNYILKEVPLIAIQSKVSSYEYPETLQIIEFLDNEVVIGNLKSREIRNSPIMVVKDKNRQYNCLVIITEYYDKTELLRYSTELHVDDSKKYYALSVIDYL